MNNERIYYSHEAEQNAMRDRSILALLALTFGIGVGTVIALMFAPNSGKVNRKNLMNHTEDTWQSGRDAVDPMIKRVENEFDDLKENVKDRLK